MGRRRLSPIGLAVSAPVLLLTMVGPPTYPAPRHVSEYSKSAALPIVEEELAAAMMG